MMSCAALANCPPCTLSRGRGGVNLTLVLTSIILAALHHHHCTLCDAQLVFPLIPTTVQEYSGTCRAASQGFRLGDYYNLDAIQTAARDLPADVSSSNWDLGKDGAFAGFNIMYCEVQDFPGYTPEGVLLLAETKGMSVERRCDYDQLTRINTTSGLLYYSILVFADSALLDGLSASEVSAINAYYRRGGALLLLSGACPSVRNVNKIIAGLPNPLNETMLVSSNNLYPSKGLSSGDPRLPNQFGFHVAFTGVPSLLTGQSGSVPITSSKPPTVFNNVSYDYVLGGGIFAPLLSHPFMSASGASSCSGDPAVSPAGYASGGFAGAMYVDPLVQLASLPEARSYGRIAIDTAISRYRGADGTRTGSLRFGANLLVWLLDIESKSASTQTDASQLVACSSGDSFRLRTIGTMCNVDFYPIDANTPRCFSKVVSSDQGTTCQVGITALYGTYWILMNGHNTSIRLVLTANLFTRVRLMASTGSCINMGPTYLFNCSTGSSIQVAWNLPSPTRGGYLSQGGPGTPAANCSSPLTVRRFSDGTPGFNVTCVLADTTRVPRGFAQLFIDDVSTGISIYVDNPTVPNVNLVLCSASHTKSGTRSEEFTTTETITLTASASLTHSLSMSKASSSPDWSNTMTLTREETETSSLSFRTESQTDVRPSRTLTRTNTTLVSVTETLLVGSSSATSTGTESLTVTDTATGTGPSPTRPSASLTISLSRTFGCVTRDQLAEALSAYASRPPLRYVDELDVQRGINVSVVMYPVPLIETEHLHIPWFQPHVCPLHVVERVLTNQGGFTQYLGRAANMTAFFLEGLGASSTLPATTTKNGVVRVELPSISRYHIFETEVIDLAISPECATLTYMCNETMNINHTSSSSPSSSAPQGSAPIPIMRLVILPNDPPVRWSALSTLQPLLILAGMFGAPHAMGSLQVMMLHAAAPCGTAFQRVHFVMDVLAVLVPGYPVGRHVDEGDVWGSVIYGALFWLIATFLLQFAAVALVACCGQLPLKDAVVKARCPALWLSSSYMYTFPGAVFSAIYWLATTWKGTHSLDDSPTTELEGDRMRSVVFLSITVILLYVLAVPGVLLFRLYFVKGVQAERNALERDRTAVHVPLSDFAAGRVVSTTQVSRHSTATSLSRYDERDIGDHPLCLTFYRFQYANRGKRRQNVPLFLEQEQEDDAMNTTDEFAAHLRTTSWRHGDRSPWGIRWLSLSLMLPLGSWGPVNRRKTYGTFLCSRFGRPERFWWFVLNILHPLLAVVLLAVAGGHGGVAGCHGVLAAVSVLYLGRIVVTHVYQPYNIRAEMILSQAMDVMVILFLSLASGQLTVPTSKAFEVALGVVFVLQILLVFLSAVLSAALRCWIEPKLRAHVPVKALFSWWNVPPFSSAPKPSPTPEEPLTEVVDSDTSSASSSPLGADSVKDLEEAQNDTNERHHRPPREREGRGLSWAPEELESGDLYIRSMRDRELLQQMHALGIMSLLEQQDAEERERKRLRRQREKSPSSKCQSVREDDLLAEMMDSDGPLASHGKEGVGAQRKPADELI